MIRICTICARGGSKGVKGKNVRLLHGLPLIAHSVRQAQASRLFDAIAVSSDSEEILNIGSLYGANYLVRRPDILATDTAAKLPVIQDCVIEAERMFGQQADICVDLDATSPLRSIEDIANAVSMLDAPDATNVITAMPARRSPYFNMVETDENGVPHISKATASQVVRRQDAPACYDMNASIYAWRRDALMANASLFSNGTRLYVMPEERSIDIDSEVDFLLVEQLMARRAVAERDLFDAI